MTKRNSGNSDIRVAFRFIKQHVLGEQNDLPTPIWAGFDQYDMFDSVIRVGIHRSGYTDDGDSKVSQIVMFKLGTDLVATVFLNGIASPWETSWEVTRVLYSEHWAPDTGPRGAMIDKVGSN